MGLHHVPKLGSRARRLIVVLVLIALLTTLFFLPSCCLIASLASVFRSREHRTFRRHNSLLFMTPPPSTLSKNSSAQTWFTSVLWTRSARFTPQTDTFVFPNIADWLLTCVKLHLWFYNAFLRLVLNASWVTWPGALFKRAWGPLIASSFKIFDKDNPHHRPRQERSVSKSNLQLLYALNAITLAGQSATVFKLSSEASFTTHLQKYRSYQGVLDSTKLHQGDLLALRHMLHYSSEMIEAPLASTGNSFSAIVDTGCSITCTNSPHDFVPGTLRALPKPIILGGIAGGLQVREQGIVHWEFLNDFGMIKTLETKAFLQEELPCRLLSPQAFLRHSSQNVSDNFRFFHDRAELHLRESRQLTFYYDSSFLPRITLFAHGTAQPSLLALYGSLVGDSNINLTPQMKHWLRWHYKLGHLAFEHVRLLGRGAFLDMLSLGLFKNATHGTPRCGACCFGKQQRKPDNIKTSSQ